MLRLKGPHHSYASLTALLYKYLSFKDSINFQVHSQKSILLAQGGAVDSERSLKGEKRLVRDNRSQSVCDPAGLQKILKQPAVPSFSGVSSDPLGGGIGVRTIHRVNGRSKASLFGHPLLRKAYIQLDSIREPNQT
jgi:hypothetical protein